MDDGLQERIAQQIRDRSMLNNTDSESHVVEQLRNQGRAERADEALRMFQATKTQRIEEEVNRTLPFALEIAERDGVTDELSDEQYHEAGIKAAKLDLHEKLRTYENRLQNAPATSPRRRFAEALLAMSKNHESILSENFTDVNSITEEDLEKTAKNIADELRKLSERDKG